MHIVVLHKNLIQIYTQINITVNQFIIDIVVEAQGSETVPGTDPLNIVSNAHSTGSTSPDAPPGAPSTGTVSQSSVRPKRDFWSGLKEKVN